MFFVAIMSFVISNKVSFASASVYKNTSSVILIEQNSLRVLYAENENERRGIASTTKIMTALCVLENNDIGKVVTITNEMVGEEGSSIYLRAGEKYTVEQLLYGLMLRSGNDASIALAVSTSGSVKNFVDLMNDKAKELKAFDTHFDNPNGLDSESHYSTAKDLAVITAFAFYNETFRKIVDTKVYSFEKIDSGEKVVWVNKNKLLKKDDSFNGVKTGFTKKCGRCLVASKETDGMQLIAVALNVGAMFERCEELLDFGFKNYSIYKIIDKNCAFTAETETLNEKVNVIVDKDVFYPLTKEEYASLKYLFVTGGSYKEKDKQLNGKIDVVSAKDLIYSTKSFIIVSHK